MFILSSKGIVSGITKLDLSLHSCKLPYLGAFKLRNLTKCTQLFSLCVAGMRKEGKAKSPDLKHLRSQLSRLHGMCEILELDRYLCFANVRPLGGGKHFCHILNSS